MGGEDPVTYVVTEVEKKSTSRSVSYGVERRASA